VNSKEDLLKLLEEAPEGIASSAVSNSVIAFVSKFNIIEGENNIPEKVLFRLYKTSVKDPVNKEEFVKLFSDLFIRYHTKNASHYKINLEAIHISEEILRIANSKKNDKTKNLQYMRTFERFLSRLDIDRGNNWLEGFVLFELFAKPHRKSGRNVPIGYRYFLQFCRLHFEEKRIGANRCSWFGISDGILKHVTGNEVDRIRRRRTRNVEKKRRSRKESGREEPRIEKEQGKVPSIETGAESKE
jgi:hypothetical protein